MSLVSDLIRSKVASVADPASLELLVGMLEDRVPANADLAVVDSLVAMAQREWSPLFRPMTTATAPAPSSSVPTGMRPPRSPGQKEADKIQAATASGNPFAKGSWNLTRQTYIEAADPALARRLRAEAGA